MKPYILHANATGEGEPIVLIHGYLASSHYFSKITPRLARTHQVITLDLLGFGLSPKPRGSYTYHDQVQAVHYTLQTLGITQPFTLVGHSMGALVALRFATVYPDSVARLQLFNPPTFTHISQLIETHRASGRHYRALLYSPLRGAYWKALKSVPYNRSRRRPPINFADMQRMSLHAREGSYKHIIGNAELFSDLRKTAVPVLFVVGRHDRSVYQQNLEGKELPHNVTLTYMETGHHPMVRNVDDSEALLRLHLPQK